MHGAYRVDSRLEFCRIDLARQRLIRQHIAHGPRNGIGIWQFTLYDYRREMDYGFSKRKRHAALAAKVFGRSSYSVRQRDVNRFVSAVDHRLIEFRPHRIWSSEISDILSSKIWCKAGALCT